MTGGPTKRRRLGDCVTFLSGGTPSKSTAAYWSGDIPWVSCKDMKTNRIFDAEDHVSEEGLANGTRLVAEGTVLIVVRGMILAREFPVAVAMRKVTFNQDLKALNCSPILDDRFLFYWLKAKTYDILGLVDEAAHGTKRLQTDRLQNLEIEIPPVSVQRDITSILSAYDDLIENNARRIGMLEQMARMIYREWFVNFRFPGHEKITMTGSESGILPVGWQVKRFTEISEVLSGGTPKTSVPEFWNGDIPFFGPTDSPTGFFVTQTEKSITRLGLSRCNSRLYPVETVFITARGTVGKVAMPAEDMAMNQSCYALRGRSGLSQLFLFMLTKEYAEELKKKAHGAVFDTITIETFSKLSVVRPADPLPQQFEAIVRPLFALMLVLQRGISHLRESRDLLLPKLLSGEIGVGHFEAEAGVVAHGV